MITENELNEFSRIIDECRILATSIEVTVQINLNYIFCLLYCKTLLTMCEIYILLLNGYPEGAMTLARNTYETMIIMSYLKDRKDDENLIRRFYDDYSIRTCADHIKYLEWIIRNGKGDEACRKKLLERRDEFNQLQERYSAYTDGKTNPYFKQYWWTGTDMSFNRLRREAKYSDNYLYDISCYRVHAGMAGMLRFDNTEEGLLIGSCDNGKELPMYFALLNFANSTKLYFDFQGKNCSAVFSKITNLLDSMN